MTADPETDLRERGLRCTAQRVAALSVLREDGGHLGADAVADRVRARLGSVSVQAVYDALAALSGAGLVHRLALGGRTALYEADKGDHHAHFVCRDCGTVVDVPATGGASRPGSALADGYEVDGTEIIHRGRCPSCRSAARPTVQDRHPLRDPQPEGTSHE